MPSPTTNRRLICLAVLAAGVACVLLAGCAFYEVRRPVATSGTVTVTWSLGQTSFEDGRCGEALRLGPGHYLIRLRSVPDFNNPGTCLSHEMLHAFGGIHQ